MFTVKVQHANGVEELYSASTIRVVGPTIPSETQSDKLIKPRRLEPGETLAFHFTDGIYLDPENTPALEGGGHCSSTVILFGSDHTDAAKARKGGRVWVMNENGATVASYFL